MPSPLLSHLPFNTPPVPAPPAPFLRIPVAGRCQLVRASRHRAAAFPSPGCGLPPPRSPLPTRGEHFDPWSRGRGCRARGQRKNASGRGRGRHGWPTVGLAFGGASGRRRRPAAGPVAHGRRQWWARLTVTVGSDWRLWRQARLRHRPPAAGGAGGTGGRWGGPSDERVAGRGVSSFDGWTAGWSGGGAGPRKDWRVTGRRAAERPAAPHLPAAPRVPSSLSSLRGWAPLAGGRRSPAAGAGGGGAWR